MTPQNDQQDNLTIEPQDLATPESQEQGSPSEGHEGQHEGQPEVKKSPQDAMNALLDSITDNPEDKGDDKPEGKEGEEGEPQAKEKPEAKQTPEEEEADLLEGVKSDRGKERIKRVFEERKAYQKDLEEFRSMVTSTGMSPQDFAETLEYGRLVRTGDEKDLRVALEMIERQRAEIVQRLGIDAPGIDSLKEYPDLQAAVEGMEITRESALEIAKYRKKESQVQQAQHERFQSQQQQEAFNQQVKTAEQQMEAYLNTRATEIDHPARMAAITEHFKDPAKLQEFVSTYKPEQWAATIKIMYDNIRLPRTPANPQPIRSRPATLGTPTASALSPIDRIAQRLDNMGI